MGVQLSSTTPASFMPPHSIEAEQALLGAILANPEAFDVAEQFVASSDFFEPVHAHLFECLTNARREGSGITLHLVKIWLRDFIDTDIAGMPLGTYIARLAAEATTVVNAPDYAKTIRELARQRELSAIGDLLIAGTKSGATSLELAAQAIEQLDAVASEGTSKSSARVSLGDAANEALYSLQDRMQSPGKLPGLSYGISRRLDLRTGGMKPGDLIVLAGRPGMGKTALGVLSAYKSAAQGNPALFFSLEMGAPSLANRVVSSICYGGPLSRLPYSDIERGEITPTQSDAFVDAARDLRNVNLEIEQQGGLYIGQIAARARRHKQQLARRGLQLGSVWVDHLGLIKASKHYAGNRVNEISEISAALKVLAKDLAVPVIALCQLNRAVEARDNKRPTLSDLRDSGAIEQDADLVLMAYREAYYLENTRCDDATQDHKRISRLGEVTTKLELIVAKNRSGQTGPLDLFADMPCNYFCDADTVAA